MNEPQNKLPDTSELSELRERCMELARQTAMLMVGLIVLSFTYAFFVGYQVRRAGKELDAVRPQARQVISASTKEEPTINAFMTKLAEYGRTHQDFAPVMAKYRLNATNAASLKTNGNAAAPLPGSNK